MILPHLYSEILKNAIILNKPSILVEEEKSRNLLSPILINNKQIKEKYDEDQIYYNAELHIFDLSFQSPLFS